MGNQCGSDCGMDDVDNLNGVRMYTNVTPQTEVFQEGALPKVNQDPHRFDDDDPIVSHSTLKAVVGSGAE